MKYLCEKKSIALLILFMLFYNGVMSQKEAEKKKKEKPVRSPFETTMLIETQTIRNPGAKSFELMIHHRFGKFGNGLSDLYGIYAPSNIRLGVNYGVTKRISVGFGTEKNNKMQEIQWKANILNQTRSGSIPIAIAYYGNFVIDARDDNVFGANYEFINRFSYFNQVIIARKFNPRFSLQLAVGYAHFNAVDTTFVHDNLGITFGGRMKVFGDRSILFEYDHPIPIKGTNIYKESAIDPKPNLAFGIELGTSTHAFQVFITNFDNIIAQKNFTYNQNDFTGKEDKEDKAYLVGFNITIRLN